jgi:hypothetical protein
MRSISCLLILLLAGCTSLYVDEDEDGYIAASDQGDDCDDNDPDVHPDAEEVCGDGVDNDCDGTVDSVGDTDADGVDACDDCDDNDPDVHIGAEEVADNGVDEDCDGVDAITCLVDSDGDGFGGTDTAVALDGVCDDEGTDQGGDCDDNVDSIHPGADEDCDGVDSDCDGSLVDSFDDFDGDGDPDCTDPDDDGDGDPDATDCAPEDAGIYTGATELCDGDRKSVV